MKKIAFIIFAFCAVSILYSCKKCLQCSYLAGKNDSIQQDLPVACGSKKDMQIMEDSIKQRMPEGDRPNRLPYYDSVSNPKKRYTSYKCVEIIE